MDAETCKKKGRIWNGNIKKCSLRGRGVIKPPKKLYHGTFKSNYNEILGEGLIPSEREGIWSEQTEYGYVFLSDSISGAKAYPVGAYCEQLESVEYIIDPAPIVFEIDTCILDLKKFSKDPITKEDWRYRGSIPPKAIKFKKAWRKPTDKECD